MVKVEKLVFIVARLVKEAGEVSNKEVEEEIIRELELTTIPWVQTIEKVTVLEE